MRSAAIETASIGIEPAEVRVAIALALTATRDGIRSGGFVLDTLTAAIWSVIRTDSFEEAVVTAVGLGGDTDTTGAVAGALAGAHYGLDAIPERWRSHVQYRDELAELARALLELSET